MPLRTRFKIVQVTETESTFNGLPTIQRTVTCVAVPGADNAAWSNSDQPRGQLELRIDNKAIGDTVQVGQHLYLDLTPIVVP